MTESKIFDNHTWYNPKTKRSEYFNKMETGERFLNAVGDPDLGNLMYTKNEENHPNGCISLEETYKDYRNGIIVVYEKTIKSPKGIDVENRTVYTNPKTGYIVSRENKFKSPKTGYIVKTYTETRSIETGEVIEFEEKGFDIETSGLIYTIREVKDPYTGKVLPYKRRKTIHKKNITFTEVLNDFLLRITGADQIHKVGGKSLNVNYLQKKGALKLSPYKDRETLKKNTKCKMSMKDIDGPFSLSEEPESKREDNVVFPGIAFCDEHNIKLPFHRWVRTDLNTSMSMDECAGMLCISRKTFDRLKNVPKTRRLEDMVDYIHQNYIPDLTEIEKDVMLSGIGNAQSGAIVLPRAYAESTPFDLAKGYQYKTTLDQNILPPSPAPDATQNANVNMEPIPGLSCMTHMSDKH